MSLDSSTIARYQPPAGDIYLALQTRYGTQNASSIATAALTGDDNGEVAAAISQAAFGSPLNTSTAQILANQLETDPLAAPLSGAENILKNSIGDFLLSPAVLLTLGTIAFLYLGGLTLIKKKIINYE